MNLKGLYYNLAGVQLQLWVWQWSSREGGQWCSSYGAGGKCNGKLLDSYVIRPILLFGGVHFFLPSYVLSSVKGITIQERGGDAAISLTPIA